MDATNAGLLLARLRANWPNVRVQAAQTDVWLDHLRDVDFELGLLAAEALIDEGGEFMPNVGQVRERVKVLKRAGAIKAETQRQLAVPPPDDEQRQSALAHIARARQAVATATALPIKPTSVTAEVEKIMAERKRAGRDPVPPEFCNAEDHSACRSGVIRGGTPPPT